MAGDGDGAVIKILPFFIVLCLLIQKNQSDPLMLRTPAGKLPVPPAAGSIS
jgi:hypothetical protein